MLFIESLQTTDKEWSQKLIFELEGANHASELGEKLV